MKYIDINGVKIPTSQIASVRNQNEMVVLVDTNNINYVLFKGTQSACDDYTTQLLTNLEWIDKLADITVHWVTAPLTLKIENGKAVIPQVLYDDKTTDISEFTLTSGTEANVKVDKGYLIGLKNGTSKITVTKEGKNATIDVTVVDPTSNIRFEKRDDGVPKNQSYTIKLLDGYGSFIPTNLINFISLDDTKATVDGSGKITGKAEGTANIVAEYQGNNYVHTVTVHPEAPAIQKSNVTLKVDETSQQSVSSPGFSNQKWLVDKSDIATVSQTGLITAKKVGTAKVTAMLTTPYEVTVKEITVTVQPADPQP